MSALLWILALTAPAFDAVISDRNEALPALDTEEARDEVQQEEQ